MIHSILTFRIIGLAVITTSGMWLTGCGVESPPRRADYSSADSISIHLGQVEKEYDGGLQHMYHEKDGFTVVATLGDVPCRHLAVQEFNPGYLYFVIDPSFKRKGAGNVDISIDYYDQGFGTLGLQFDATGSKKFRSPAYADVGTTISLWDTKEWKTATFRVRNASFKNSQNSGSDFRFVVQPPDLYVRRVTVTRAK